MTKPSNIKLSICIATFNRAGFIGATLESIIGQATNDCEIIVLDGASTDGTEEVVAEYGRRFERLRYVRQNTNNGVDRDFDRVVDLASGEYCWLFSDDDLLKPGAVEAILQAIHCNYSLILVNGEHRDFNMLNVRVPSFFGIGTDRVYASKDMDRLFTDVGTCLICICCVVIKRSIWLARERQRYYGSRFIHVGVIFQESIPGRTLAIAEPLMSLRIGNEQTHGTDAFQVWYIGWPSLVWSLALSEATKNRFCNPEPWKRLHYLLALRAMGRYTYNEYRCWVRPRLRSFMDTLIPSFIVFLPRKLAYRVYVLYSSISGQGSSPQDASSTMFPQSLKELRNTPIT